MTTTICALSGEYLDTKAFRFARNQRDAGIEHLEWESRLKPLRPWSHDIALGLGVAMAAAAAAFFV
jgi:hypothetical protein